MLTVLPATRSKKPPDFSKLPRFEYLDKIIRIPDFVQDAVRSDLLNTVDADLSALNLAELAHNSSVVGNELAAVIKTVAAKGTLVEVSGSNGHLSVYEYQQTLPELLARSVEANNSLLEHANNRVREVALANVGILDWVLSLYRKFSSPAPEA
ncbi:MAG: hypothetical protein O2962_04720 [Cyanobacteria bacterium]|nr:hypothetical protein [Cyanobacteriota bacterium]